MAAQARTEDVSNLDILQAGLAHAHWQAAWFEGLADPGAEPGRGGHAHCHTASGTASGRLPKCESRSSELPRTRHRDHGDGAGGGPRDEELPWVPRMRALAGEEHWQRHGSHVTVPPEPWVNLKPPPGPWANILLQTRPLAA